MKWIKNATRYSRLIYLYPFFTGRIKRDSLLLVESDKYWMDIYFEEGNIKKQSDEEIAKVFSEDYATLHLNKTNNIAHEVNKFCARM
ncbi:MAG: hypothetical protein Q8O89_08170, partial [Nanoarchaeota archaeon]|nr:hypothetical protein [Nanoarchaeota archaeon]